MGRNLHGTSEMLFLGSCSLFLKLYRLEHPLRLLTVRYRKKFAFFLSDPRWVLVLKRGELKLPSNVLGNLSTGLSNDVCIKMSYVTRLFFGFLCKNLLKNCLKVSSNSSKPPQNSSSRPGGNPVHDEKFKNQN